MRGFGVLFCLLVSAQTGLTQLYPRWFLEQGALRCKASAVGYANRGFYKDSSASQAVRDARRELAVQRLTVVSGGQAFWATEAGTAWMGGNLSVSADSAALRRAVTDSAAADVYFGESMVLALVTDGECAVPDSMRQLVAMPAEEPAWVKTAPDRASRVCSVGLAPAYFYESSSWQSAERAALLGLAKEGGDSVAAIEKNTSGSGQQVLAEHVEVALRAIGTVARWFDSKKHVYYVLMSVGRNQVEKHPATNIKLREECNGEKLEIR